MKVLVTGGSGFIGTHLIKTLESSGHQTYNVDVANQKNPIDIRQPLELSKVFSRFRPDIVVHLAALASIPLCETYPVKAYKTNLLGTLYVTKSAAKQKAKLIFASSAAVYGNPHHLPTPEDYPQNPVNIYGATKLAAEHLVKTIAPSSFVIFRIFNAYGSHCNRHYVIPDTIRKILSGKNPAQMIGTGEESRDFVYISDVIDALLRGINANVTGIYNVGTGITVPIKVLARKIAKIMGLDVTFVFNDSMRPGDFKVNMSDITKIKKRLGWRPKVKLEEGLRKTIRWFVANRAKTMF
jgi:nucleoside-diphosphate-sugar epimerase